MHVCSALRMIEKAVFSVHVNVDKDISQGWILLFILYALISAAVCILQPSIECSVLLFCILINIVNFLEIL